MFYTLGHMKRNHNMSVDLFLCMNILGYPPVFMYCLLVCALGRFYFCVVNVDLLIVCVKHTK